MKSHIKHDAIEDLSTRLSQVIIDREESLRSTEANIVVVEDLTTRLNMLRDIVTRGKNQLKEGKKELQEMRTKQREISGIKEIDTDDPNSDTSIMSFVEGESIISNAESAKYSDTIASLNEHLKIALDNIGQFLKGHELKSPVRGSAENRPYTSPFEQVDDNPKEEVKVPRSAVVLEPAKVHELPRPGKLTSASGIMTVSKEGELVPLSSIKLSGGKSEVAELAAMRKKCKGCGKLTESVLLFKCQCALCISCLQKQLLKRNEKLLSNTFESAKKQDAMCVCSAHSCAVNMTLLSRIFLPQQIERASIDALKRQLKFGISLFYSWKTYRRH